MTKELKVTAVAPKGKSSIEVTFDGRETMTIDLSEMIDSLESLRQLGENADLFRSVRIGQWGWSIEWSDEMAISSENVYRVGLEQAGMTMPVGQFREWRHRNKLTQSEAADALGLSRRTVVDYEQGRALISRTVGLATAGYEFLKGPPARATRKTAHYVPRSKKQTAESNRRR